MLVQLSVWGDFFYKRNIHLYIFLTLSIVLEYLKDILQDILHLNQRGLKDFQQIVTFKFNSEKNQGTPSNPKSGQSLEKGE